MKITIAGAGAMGMRFGIMLQDAGNEVILVDNWQEHVNTMNENGIIASFDGEERRVKIPAFLPQQIAKDFKTDIIIVLTKARQLDEMLQAITPIISEKTAVLCLLNGIGHEEIMKKYVNIANILLGETIWSADLEGPGRVKLLGSGTIELRNLATGGEQMAHEVARVFSEAGLRASYADNIMAAIYRKACVNGALNGVCTLLETNYAGFIGTTSVTAIIEAIVGEFVAVANAENIVLDSTEISAYIKGTCDVENGIGLHYPSMYQDLILNNRKTEIDCMNGAIMRKGLQYNIATPYCTLLTALVHAKEELCQAR